MESQPRTEWTVVVFLGLAVSRSRGARKVGHRLPHVQGR